MPVLMIMPVSAVMVLVTRRVIMLICAVIVMSVIMFMAVVVLQLSKFVRVLAHCFKRQPSLNSFAASTYAFELLE